MNYAWWAIAAFTLAATAYFFKLPDPPHHVCVHHDSTNKCVLWEIIDDGQ